MLPDRREGGNKCCFCLHLSVCLSVAYIANNSRTRRPSMPKFGMKVPHLRCDSHTSQTVKGQGYRRACGIPYPLSPIVWDMPINIQVSLPRLQNLNFIYLLRTFTLSVNCITGIILTFIVPLCFYICLNVCTTLNVLVIVLNPAPCCYTSIKSMCVLAEPGDHIVCYLN